MKSEFQGKYLRLIGICLIFFLASFRMNQGKITSEQGIRLSVTGLRNNDGHVLVCLFREGEGFPDEVEKAFRREKMSISQKTSGILFKDVPGGNYAIAILHDENDDQKMNKNFFGLPKEGYGFSNNVMGTFGPPSYSRAKFAHSPGGITGVSIEARY